MQWCNQTISHSFSFSHIIQSSLTQNNIDVICQSNVILWHIHSRRDSFSRFVFHLVQNVYHKPLPPAAGHLALADSAHSRSLPHPSVKSRGQTQSKFSLLQKTVFMFFFFFKKTIFGNTFKILCSLPWIQGPAPEDGKPPLPPKSFTTPTRATGLTGPQRLLPAPWCPLYISSVQSLSHVQLFAISWGAACQVSLSTTNSQSLLKLTSIASLMPSNRLSFVVPFFSRLQSFPASGPFLMSQFFASGGQSIGGSASASVLPMNIKDWFPLGWPGWIS